MFEKKSFIFRGKAPLGHKAGESGHVQGSRPLWEDIPKVRKKVHGMENSIQTAHLITSGCVAPASRVTVIFYQIVEFLINLKEN